MMCDVYAVEPIHLNLLATVRAGESGCSSFGDVFLDVNSKTLVGGGVEIALSRYEFSILWLLVRAQGGFVNRDVISYFLYDDSDEDMPLSNTVEVFLCRLRKKLVEVSRQVRIINFRSYGFGLECFRS
jgi:DNA-binding response OmpR family regulator